MITVTNREKYSDLLVKNFYLQNALDESPDSNSELIKSGRALRRRDHSRRKHFNLTLSHDETIDDLSEGDQIDINRIYTPWSRWSRCSRRCKQKRERRCAEPQVRSCGITRVNMDR